MKAQRSPVVECYARSWPRDVITLINNRRNRQDASLADAAAFLEMPGVYVLYQAETVYYIGKASNLGKRLRTHTRLGGRYSEHWTHISVFAIPDEAHRSSIESVLIASIRSANGAKPRIKRVPVACKGAEEMAETKDHLGLIDHQISGEDSARYGSYNPP